MWITFLNLKMLAKRRSRRSGGNEPCMIVGYNPCTIIVGIKSKKWRDLHFIHHKRNLFESHYGKVCTRSEKQSTNTSVEDVGGSVHVVLYLCGAFRKNRNPSSYRDHLSIFDMRIPPPMVIVRWSPFVLGGQVLLFLWVLLYNVFLRKNFVSANENVSRGPKAHKKQGEKMKWIPLSSVRWWYSFPCTK